MHAVHCTGISKYFGSGEARVAALQNADFEARFAELTFVMGPSGCGKTTLISVIAGLLDADEGALHILGDDLRHARSSDKRAFRRENVGFVFQQYNLLPALTAVENVTVPLLVGGVKRSAANERAAAMLDSVGLGDRLHALPSQLSGGQQQRVALARALVHEPKLVVCDEPTAALDHRTGDAVMELLARHAIRSDRAVIVVTHDARVLRYAHRVAHMDDGRIVNVEQPTDKEVA